MTVELFADYYRWTVSTGANDAPTAGTSETVTVTSATGAPAASNSASPPTQFRVVDAADPNFPPEVMTVTNVAGATWTLTRGAEGAAPWAHAANWVAVPVATATALGTFQAAVYDGGVMFLRPNGPTSTTGQVTVTTTGQVSAPAGVKVGVTSLAAGQGPGIGSDASTNLYVISGSSSTGIYFRPNGPTSTSMQGLLDAATGSLTLAGAVSAALTGTAGRLVGATSGKPGSTSGFANGDVAVDTLLNSLWAMQSGAWQVITDPSGTVQMSAAITVPVGWLLCDGTAYSRTTYANLFNAITIRQNGTTTISANTVTGLTDTTNMKIGMPLSGPGIPAGATIASITSGTAITMSANATASATVAVVVAPFGVGDGSTTFNVPNYSSGNFPRGGTLGATGGSATAAHTHTHGATHTHTAAAHSHTLSDAGVATLSWAASGAIIMRRVTSSVAWTASSSVTQTALAGNTTSNTNSLGLAGNTDSATPGASGATAPGTTDSTAPAILPPYQQINFVIKT